MQINGPAKYKVELMLKSANGPIDFWSLRLQGHTVHICATLAQSYGSNEYSCRRGLLITCSAVTTEEQCVLFILVTVALLCLNPAAALVRFINTLRAGEKHDLVSDSELCCQISTREAFPMRSET